MTEDDDEFEKVIGRIHAAPGYGLAYVEMMKANYRRWAAEGDPMYIEIVKQMDGDDTEDQDDPSAHHGHARR
jgi:predicted lipoprotein with Yx(FWY)xxD motif